MVIHESLSNYQQKETIVGNQTFEFIKDRLKTLLKEKNISHDVISAVIDGNKKDDLLDLFYEVCHLHDFLLHEGGINLKAVWNRVANILNVEEKKSGEKIKAYFHKSINKTHQEEELINAIKQMRFDDNFDEILIKRSCLKKLVDNYFDRFTINDPNLNVKKRRLELLAFIRLRLLDIGDLSMLEG